MWKRLNKWQNNLRVGMTKDKYLKICEQLGEEPKDEKCPPDYEDFPETLQIAIEIFNKMGDRVYPDIGYVGKDYTSFQHHLDVFYITDKELILEAITRLDAHMIERSAEQLKQARKAAKNKSNGNK